MSKYYLGPDGRIYSEDELCHHGVPGMKWGVRRFQRKDGSLTPAGRKHRVNQPTTSSSPKTTTNANGKKSTKKASKTKLKISKTQRGTKVVFKNKDIKMKALVSNTANVAAGAMRVAALFIPGGAALNGAATVASLVSTVAALK